MSLGMSYRMTFFTQTNEVLQIVIHLLNSQLPAVIYMMHNYITFTPAYDTTIVIPFQTKFTLWIIVRKRTNESIIKLHLFLNGIETKASIVGSNVKMPIFSHTKHTVLYHASHA